MNLTQIFAITKKEIKLSFRFKWNYFGAVLMQPLRFVILFLVVYSGFFLSGAKEIGEVTKENFVSFLIIGGLIHAFFDSGLRIFSEKFIQEKYWQTISSFLIAPVHKLKVIIGIGLSESIRLGIIVTVYFGITYLIAPIGVGKLFLAMLVVILLFFGALGVSLVVGAFSLANEDVLFLFNYTFWGWAFLSCFYYPLSILPKFLHPLVMINPVYHAVSYIRELWFGLSGDVVTHFYFIISFAVIAPLLGAFAFNEIIKKQGVTGY